MPSARHYRVVSATFFDNIVPLKILTYFFLIGSDVQSLSSRLSTFSMETTRSEQQDYHHLSSNRHKPSSNQSSDYEDHELPSPTGRPTTEGAVNHKHNRHRKPSQDKESSRGKNNIPSASSAESIPSGSGSSTQVNIKKRQNQWR